MKIAPSVLAADFSNLECELKDIETGGADFSDRFSAQFFPFPGWTG